MPHVDTPQACCRFGIGRRDITPPVGIYHRLWGAAKHDKATGIHRPLTASALVFRPEKGDASPANEQIVVAMDLCLLWWREMQTLLEKVCKQLGLARETIVCVFSHTHAGGLPGLERINMPGGDLIPAYLDLLAERVAEAVHEARQSVAPATLIFGQGTSPLAAHRDFWDEASKQFVCGFNPTGSIDQTVLVTKVVGPENRILATMVNYACHPTTLAWDNTLISPDFPGAMAETVEKATGAPCVFLQGASGEVGPREGFVGDTAVADRNGRQLGYTALAVLEALPPPATRFEYTGPVISGATIGTWAHKPVDPAARDRHGRWRLKRWEVPLAYRPGMPTKQQTEEELARWQADEEKARKAGDQAKASDCRAMAERMRRRLNVLAVLPPGPTFPFPVVAWRMGDAFWVAVESEHYNLLQSALRQRFPNHPVVVITLANGSRAAYLPTAETYGKNIYQESIAVLAPGCLEQLIGVIGQEMRAWEEEA